MYVYICHPRNQRPRKKVCFRIHQHSFLWKHFKENMPVAFRLSQKGQSLIWPLPRGWTKRFGASLLIWILKFGYYYFFQNISLGSILDCSFTWHSYWYKNIEEKPNRFLNLAISFRSKWVWKKNPEKNVNTCLGLKSLGKCLDDSTRNVAFLWFTKKLSKKKINLWNVHSVYRYFNYLILI